MDILLLNQSESERLESLESTISKGLDTFIEVGVALAEIKSSGLYRDKFCTFEDYCRNKWRMAARTAYQLISSSGACSQLAGLEMPANESIARVLTNLNPDERRDMWLLAFQENQHCTAEKLKSFLKSLRKLDYNTQQLNPVTQSQCPKCRHVYELLQPEKASRGSRVPSWCINWAATQIPKGIDAIDYGCGRFRNTLAIQSQFTLIASVDTFIQRQRVEPIAPNGAGLISVDEFDGSAIQANVVFLVSVIHIIPEHEVIRVIKCIKRHLHIGGYCLVEWPRNATYYRAKARAGRNTQQGYYHEPNDEEMARWFCGFVKVAHSRKGYSLATIYRYDAHN